MTVKEHLHHLVDYLRWLASEEPEELTQEEWKGVYEGQAQLDRGEGIPWEEAKRRQM